MEGDSVKDYTELDFSTVDLKSGSWCYGRGGRGRGEWDFCISHVSSDLVETVYYLPPCLNQMLEQQFGHGRDEAINDIHRALKIR